MKIIQCSALMLSLVFLLSGCGNKAQGAGKGGNGKGGGMPPMMQEQTKVLTAVEVTKIEKSSIGNEYMYSGTIAPSAQVNVLSTSNGKVATVNFDVGDKVNKGDVLFTMDTTDIQNSINEANASLKSVEASIKSAQTNLELANGANVQSQIQNAQNSIDNAQNSIEKAQSDIETSKINLDNAEISLNKAKSDYETNKLLYEAGGISKEAFENYEDTYTKAQNSYEQSKTAYSQSELSLKQANDNYNQALASYEIVAKQTPEENIRKAQDSYNSAVAQKASSEARLATLQKSLSDASVKSPISGTVLECNVTAGAVLSQSSPFVIIDLNTVNIEVNVSEQMINSVKVGDSVNIKVSTLSSETFKGNVSTIAPGANSDGTYKIKIEINNHNGKLKAGMFAEVYFVREKSDNTIVLPRNTVISKNDENYVFVEENGVVTKTNVTLGIDNGDEIEITEGLNEGMNVVTKGQTYLKDGDTVNVINDEIENQDTENQNMENNEQENPNQNTNNSNKPFNQKEG